MNHLKTIALLAVAAMALLAAVASVASAATVCSTSGTGAACGAGHGNVYTGSLVGKNSGNVAFTVTNSEGQAINTVTATGSELAGEITNGETGAGKITRLTFSGVSSNICGAVTADSSASPGNPWAFSVTTEVTGVQNTNGTMTIELPTLTFSCSFLGFPVTCKYKAAKAETKITGSDTAPKIIVTNVPLELEESGNATICGTKSDWNGTYKISTPTSLFIE